MNPETKYQEAPPPYPQGQYGEQAPPTWPQGQYGGQAPPPQNTVDPTSDPNYRYDDKPIVIQPGFAAVPQEPYVDVPDYLVLSIISIFFCTCLGIYSIVKASSARQMKAVGRYQSAFTEAKSARQTAAMAIVVGSILTILMVIVRVALHE